MAFYTMDLMVFISLIILSFLAGVMLIREITNHVKAGFMTRKAGFSFSIVTGCLSGCIWALAIYGYMVTQ